MALWRLTPFSLAHSDSFTSLSLAGGRENHAPRTVADEMSTPQAEPTANESLELGVEELLRRGKPHRPTASREPSEASGHEPYPDAARFPARDHRPLQEDMSHPHKASAVSRAPIGWRRRSAGVILPRGDR